MFKTEKIERLIELALLTGFCKEDVPLSLMLIASPESGKTSVIRMFDCYKTLETADISPKVISTDIVPMLERYELNHIVIPDLVKILAHKPATVNSTIAFFNALMEEGIKSNMFFGQKFKFDKPRYCGIITSVTFDYFRKYAKKWNEIGFMSRFLPISYKYTRETVSDIHKLIQQNTFYKEIKSIGNDNKEEFDKEFIVEIPDDIASFISLHAQDIAKRESGFTFRTQVQGGNFRSVKFEMLGFRLQRQLRQLARAIALSDNYKNPTLTWSHIEELKTLFDYIRLPSEPKLI